MAESPIDRIICAEERRELVPYSDMHVSRLEQAGLFPVRIRLGPNRVGWSLKEIQDWIDARKAERDIDHDTRASSK
jgi:prophage regulatory protein